MSRIHRLCAATALALCLAWSASAQIIQPPTAPGDPGSSTGTPAYTQDGSDPTNPPLANPGTGARGWLAGMLAALGLQSDTATVGISSSGSLIAIAKQIRVLLSAPLPLASAAGTDASGSAPGVGNVLTTFTVSSPGQYRVQNQSASTLQVILDDGLGGTPSIFLIGPGSAGTQGGDTSPELKWFVGRVRVAGPAGSQFAARHN